jgi:hypothetical protein
METKLERIAEVAKAHPSMKFTSLAHLLDKDMLKQCLYELAGKKATGIKGTIPFASVKTAFLMFIESTSYERL